MVGAAKVNGGVVASKPAAGRVATTTSRNGVTATAAASSSCLRATVAELVVGGVCIPNKFTIIAKVDTHIRKTDLSVVYINDPIMVENSINTIEQLLAEDDKYKVVVFNLEHTNGRAGYDQKVVVT
ncbi:hypothetical protein D1007_59676 [Hordeum vulgare]|nr:hypothetical protein D1007_59676 [Hordeum vulgare]